MHVSLSEFHSNSSVCERDTLIRVVAYGTSCRSKFVQYVICYRIVTACCVCTVCVCVRTSKLYGVNNNIRPKVIYYPRLWTGGHVTWYFCYHSHLPGWCFVSAWCFNYIFLQLILIVSFTLIAYCVWMNRHSLLVYFTLQSCTENTVRKGNESTFGNPLNYPTAGRNPTKSVRWLVGGDYWAQMSQCPVILHFDFSDSLICTNLKRSRVTDKWNKT